MQKALKSSFFVKKEEELSEEKLSGELSNLIESEDNDQIDCCSDDDDDEDEPHIMDINPKIYNNPNGTVFITVGTGGAHDMEWSSLEDFSAIGIDGEFGILNEEFENSKFTNNTNNINNNDINNYTKILTGKFIENEDDDEFKILDEFKIVKIN